MRNCYKREDVFLCRHDAHRRFDHRISAFHVLREKRCYPDGCVSFLWKCKLLDKGGACPKRYRHVGNNCTQCRSYTEEKIHRRPEIMLAPEAFESFRDECRRFDEWLEDHGGRLLQVGGLITHLHPHLVQRREGRHASLSLRGFLVRLMPAYVGLRGLEDALYMRMSRVQQQRVRFAVGDGVEAEGWLRMDRGRIVVEPLRRVHRESSGGGTPAQWDRALLDRTAAVRLATQPGRCLGCERGLLVDVEDVEARSDRRGDRRGGPGNGRRRELLCLEGIGRPADCPYEGLVDLREGTTVTLQGGSGCNLSAPPA
jgi:hypothetical protein